jgi:hypothetical protein
LKKVKGGVSQDSFQNSSIVMYINDKAESFEPLTRMFPVDTSLMHSSHSNEIFESVVNSDLLKIEAW